LALLLQRASNAERVRRGLGASAPAALDRQSSERAPRCHRESGPQRLARWAGPPVLL